MINRISASSILSRRFLTARTRFVQAASNGSSIVFASKRLYSTNPNAIQTQSQQPQQQRREEENDNDTYEEQKRKLPRGSFRPFFIALLFTGIGIYFANKNIKGDVAKLYTEDMLKEPKVEPLTLPQQDEAIYSAILKALNDKNFELVLDSTEELLKQNPSNLYALYFKAKALYSLGMPIEAQQALDKVLVIYKNSGDQYKGFKGAFGDALHTLTLCLYQLQKFHDALRINGLLVLEQPWNLEFISERADLFAHVNDYISSIEWCDKLLSLMMDYPDVFDRNLKASYTEEISKTYFVSEVYRIKGFSMYKQQKLDDALKCFTNAIELNPKKNLLYSSRGEILARLGRFEEAYQTFSAAPGADTSRYFVFQRIEALANMKRFEEALALHKKLITVTPNDPANARIDALVTRAKLQMGAKKYEELLQTTGELEPLYPTEALRLRAFALGGLDRFNEALQSVNKALELTPNDQKLLLLRDSIMKRL